MREITPGMCLFLTAASNLATHLYVVLTEPEGDPPAVALANFTSYKTGCDETVLLEVGEHSFIKKKSFINYDGATVVKVSVLQALMAADITVCHQEHCSTELLERIRKGVYESPFTTPKFQRYCRGKF